MEIVFQIGAKCTDEDQLFTSMALNDAVFDQERIFLPQPRNFRPQVRELIGSLNGRQLSPSAQESFLNKVLMGREVNRVVFCDEGFLGGPAKVFDADGFYSDAQDRVRGLANLFTGHDVAVCLGIRNPASFIPALYSAADATGPVSKFLSGVPFEGILWSEVVTRMRISCPNIPITIWCNEDTPVLWPQLIRVLSGIRDEVEIMGQYDLLQSIISEAGYKSFQAFVTKHSFSSVDQQSRVMMSFLSRFAREEAIIEDVTLDDWTIEISEQLTAQYHQDIARLRDMDGVFLIEPN